MIEKLRELAAQHDLADTHSAQVMAETRAWVVDPGIDDPTLTDLCHLPFCTIDEVESKDLDQALYVEQTAQGLVLWYAIADAAHFVPRGSATFAEALRRGATYYLPGLVLPMLPRELSEDLCSLNAGVHRRALVWRMPLKDDGSIGEVTLTRARIRSRAKLAYDHVDRWLKQGTWPELDDGVRASLERLPEAGRLRMQHAQERDVVRYRRRQLAFSLSPGEGIAVWTDLRNDVERYNEQLSLLCNSTGAAMLMGRPDIAGIYRVHPSPPGDRVEELRARIAGLCALRGLSGPYLWEGQSLADYLEGLPQGPLATAIHRQAMVANRASTFAPEPAPHHGVGAEAYGRFSAPMREVVGVYLHAELLGLAAPDAALRDQVIEASNQARQTQKTLDKAVNLMAIDALFQRDVDQGAPPRLGTVVGITRSRVHLQMDDPAIELKAYAQDLSWALVPHESGAAAMAPDGSVRLALGDRARARVLGKEGERWRLDIVD